MNTPEQPSLESLPTDERTEVKAAIRNLHYALIDQLVARGDLSRPISPAVYNGFRDELTAAIYPLYAKHRAQ